MWRRITRNKKSSRKEIVLNLDTEPQEGLWSAAIRSGDLKLIWGQDKLLKQKVGFKSCMRNNLELSSITKLSLSVLKMPESANNVELFDVIKDPNETTNLVRSHCC